MATRIRGGSVPRAARREYWRAQIEAHRQSGLRQGVFCARRGLRKGTFSFWKWKLTQEAGAGRRGGLALARRSAPGPAFVPIQIRAARPSSAVATTHDGEVEITLGADRCVRVRGRVDPTWLVQVLRGIEGREC